MSIFFEGVRGSFNDLVFLTKSGKPFSHGSRGGHECEGFHWEFAFLKNFYEGLPYETCCANYRDAGTI